MSKKRTSDWLSQFKTTNCTFSQDIVDGLRNEIKELKEQLAKLQKENTELREDNNKLGAECVLSEKLLSEYKRV